MIKIEVLSVNISEKKGVVKKPVESIALTDTGVEKDAHAGKWHRQVSMLGAESFEKFSAMAGREIAFGEFAENITTKGLKLYETSVLDRFYNENVELEVTQIGKKCHGDRCAIYQEVGNCVMPKEGIFCRVIKEGVLKPGDQLIYSQRVFRARVITLSDRASSGEYEDRSGPEIKRLLEDHYKDTRRKIEIENILIPDSEEKLVGAITDALEEQVDFIFTTGGTGVGERDITPDTIATLLDKEIPGIMENIRLKFGQEKPNALLSRGIAGVVGKTQVYTLPGSVRAVKEYMGEILKTLDHLVLMLYSIDAH